MNIRKETIYIMESGGAEKVLRLNEHAKLVFHDGGYHAGELVEITDRVVTLSRNDEDYSYSISAIQDINQ